MSAQFGCLRNRESKDATLESTEGYLSRWQVPDAAWGGSASRQREKTTSFPSGNGPIQPHG